MSGQCRLCNCDGLTSVLDLGQQPLANKYPSQDKFANEMYYPLDVLFCEQCTAVQLSTIVSRSVMFEDYFYLSSVNPGLVRHFEVLADDIRDAKFVVDIGSNDGVLLKHLKSRNVKALGVEPSVNVSKIANDNDLETVCAFYARDVAEEIVAKHGAADVIVASSVFTHLDKPHEFVEAVKVLLSENGIFIIEVEYIANLIEQTQFERFYLDRIFYYSVMSLRKFFESHGLEIVDVESISTHGGSIRVKVARTGRVVVHDRVAAILAEELKTMNSTRLAQFRSEASAQINELVQLLKRWSEDGAKVAGYGAPARLSTICNFGDIGPELIAYTVDDSPLKAGKYSPGTHIPIVSQDRLAAERPDYLIVFAYEYFDDIVSKIGRDYTFYMPIPPKQLRP